MMTEEKQHLITVLKARGYRQLLVINVNSFTRKTEGAYVIDLISGERGPHKTRAEMAAWLQDNYETPLDVCYV